MFGVRSRAIETLTIIVVMSILSSCSNEPSGKPTAAPSINKYQANETIVRRTLQSNSWKFWLSAVKSTQDAYHLIVDTSIADLEEDPSEVSRMITIARDQVRMAESYGVESPTLESRCTWKMSQLDDAKQDVTGEIVTSYGLRVYYSSDYVERKGPGCVVAFGAIQGIESSRGILILQVSSNPYFVEPFDRIAYGDVVDIEDIIVRIKR